uniref:Ig-like domain-containing protein n=1 Tax=Sander lucioperca TaxID=283035 RepID=A0A8C9Z6D2_SANLU
MIHLFLCMFSSSPECKGEDSVIQLTGDVIITEGDTVTLGCKFVTDRTPTLYWYKQKENDYPKMLLQRFSVKTENAKAQERIDFEVEGKQIHMNISSAKVSDSAVYYCAVKPTVTGNTKTLYKNLWSKDNTILHNVHQRESYTVKLQVNYKVLRDLQQMIKRKDQ